MKLFNYLFGRLSKDIGIDLGTANTVIYVNGEGISLNEPSVVALDKNSKQVLAIGNEAYEMVGRTPGNIIAVRPMKSGVIADFAIAEKMIKAFIEKTVKKSKLYKPRILVGIPWGITEVEKRAVFDASKSAGAKETLLIEEPMAAAIGANIQVTEPEGRMVVDIGGGTTEVAVISLGGIVTCRSIRVAGDEFNDAIVSHCRKNYNLLIGERMAEKVKIEIGSAYPFEEEKNYVVRGRDLLSGLPRNFNISSYEIRDALAESVSAIIGAVRMTLEKTPPELSADIMEKGIIMTGGSSLLYGLERYLYEETGIHIITAEDPLSCVAVGTGKVLEERKTLELVSSTITTRMI